MTSIRAKEDAIVERVYIFSIFIVFLIINLVYFWYFRFLNYFK
jgi:hypothetical protein